MSDQTPPPAKKPAIKAPATKTPATDFERQAEEAQPGLIAEFIDFLIHSKKWWLTPILVVLLMIGFLIFLAATPAGPFIYSFF
ncbi:MAG: DUF5989 family protein [Planctomycetaceae bacterium]